MAGAMGPTEDAASALKCSAPGRAEVRGTVH